MKIMALSKIYTTSVLGFCAIVTLINCLRKLHAEKRFLSSSITKTTKPALTVLESTETIEPITVLESTEPIEPIITVLESTESTMDHHEDVIYNMNPSPQIRDRCMELQMGSFYIAKENSDNPFGEDAHFISERNQIFGLADGVSGWARRGIDSGKYACELMENALFAIIDNPTDVIDPMQVLKEAFSKTKSEGSSTACIVTLNSDLLQAVNIGDSGFIVIREGKIVCKTTPRQHRFNCPYQLGSSSSSSQRRGDIPNAVDEIFFPVKFGDVVVAGTDGLFDNVYPSEIVDLVKTCRREADLPAETASKIAKVALSQSLSRDKVSPFARAAMKAGISNSSRYTGGKIDDVTVIVAYVVQPLDWV